MPGPDVRIPYVRRCVVQRGSQRSDGVVCSLGRDGAYVTFLSARSSIIPETGESVVLSFGLPGDPAPVQTRAEVVARNVEGRQSIDGPPRGCALRFTGLRAADDSRLAALIEDYRTAPHPRIAVTPPHSGFLRVPYVEPCLLVGEHTTWEGVICNMSVLGVYVASQPGPPMGEPVRLFFRTPGHQDPMEVACEVAWSRPDDAANGNGLPSGCGLRFLDDAARPEIELMILEYESLPRS